MKRNRSGNTGLTALARMTDVLNDNDKIKFFAVQTVFKDQSHNTFETPMGIQDQYGLKIPFSHNGGGGKTKNTSGIMYHYRLEGTPWLFLPSQIVLFLMIFILVQGSLQIT